MKAFTRFSLITTVATYFLIFIGGLVRVSGAGLGCPDWPKCFGRWMPPTSIDQVPPEMLDQFNMTLAWIEYINRLCGMTVGILILITAIWAIRKFRQNKKILYPACGAAILTALQGWQGSVVVKSLLEPVVITVHMLLALLIVSLLIYTTAQAYFHEHKNDILYVKVPKNISKMTLWLWVVGMIQILLGTQVRMSIEKLMESFPDLSSGVWLLEVGMLNHLHMLLGVFVVAFAWMVGFTILRFKEQLPLFMRQSSLVMMLIATGQLLLGMTFIVFDLRPLFQVFHLWLASLFIGLAMLLYLTCKQNEIKGV